MEHKSLIAQRDNNRSTRHKTSFSGEDSLKTLSIPNGTHTQPGSKRPQAVRSVIYLLLMYPCQKPAQLEQMTRVNATVLGVGFMRPIGGQKP